MPTGRRAQTGLLIESDDRSLLLDCGSGVLSRLATTEPGFEDIDAVLLTHHHLDHVSDLMVLFKARWLAGAGGLPIAGPAGTAELVDGLFEVHEYMKDRLETPVTELEAGSDSFAGFDLEARDTRHSLPCLAYRFGDAVAFSGDSEAFESLAAFADGVDVFVHDCSFPDDVDVSNHPTPSQLGAVLADHSYGTVFLTHLYPHTAGEHEAMLESLGERYAGAVRFAEDGLTVEV
jgi:ribonuclease BN (tRNA processing enzyme)